MAITPVHGRLQRLRTGVASGPSSQIVDAVQALLDSPLDEGLIDLVVGMVLQDSTAFMSALLEHFVVIGSGTRANPNANLPSFPCGMAKQWQNYVSTQSAEPFEIACPGTLTELEVVLAHANALGCPVRAAGSHHAWSDAALTDGIAIETHRLIGPPTAVDSNLLKSPDEATTLRQVSGGMTIRDLNTALDHEGLALINMGGFDGQTLAGVISTSTHGSGLSLGAFPSFAEALIVINGDGQILQIEKANGITDPVKFAAQGGRIQLIQDDKIFNAAVVGVGCLGIIYAVILRVRSRYWLSETRTVHRWTALRDQLREGSILRNYRHVEVLINPHMIDGDNTCLLTLRSEVPKPSVPSHPKPFRDLFSELLARIPHAGEGLALLLQALPTLTPKLVEDAIKNLEDQNEFVALSYTMLNVGAANGFPMVCSELAVDLDTHVDAAQAALSLAARSRAEGTYQSGVISLRYVGPSPGFLSMQPRETCMIELPMFRDVFGSESLPWRYEEMLTKNFRARPHWGQRNFLTGSHELLDQIYGPANVSNWMGVFQSFNPRGQFYSIFTDRLGFSSHAPGPARPMKAPFPSEK